MSQLWLKMTACDLGRGIDNGSVSPIALLKTYLEAISEHPLKNQIYVHVATKRAMREAEDAELRAIKK